ncbi:RadC family protein [Brackiella oedipodis]|uniref:RadC family protein n=1 Tax=Brackiella oedipodis TaxID=124225 RepID=UPI001FE1009D|nr:DNA repair protein RadC [Brackiella oedipodis]
MNSRIDQPRERLLQHGPKVLTTSELLALILGTGMYGCNVVQFCNQLLNHFGSLRKLLNAESKQLQDIKGLGAAKTCQLLAIKELANRCLHEELKIGVDLHRSEVVKHYCCSRLGDLTIEHCIALYLDSQYRLICSEDISQGTLSQTSVYPREVVKSALKHHAAAVIMSHNHPSGLLYPSTADLQLTQLLKNSLKLVDVKLLDHVIVSGGKSYSMAEQNQV